MDERVSPWRARPDRRMARRGFMRSLVAATAGVILMPRRTGARWQRFPPQIVWAASDFEPLVGARFELVGDGPHSEVLWLESVTEVGRPGAGGPSGRTPFSLVFTGRPEGPRDQATYRLRHPAAGETTLLLVPIDRSGNVPRFEAVVG